MWSRLHPVVTHSCVWWQERCWQGPSHSPSALMALSHTICGIPTLNSGHSFSSDLLYNLAGWEVRALGVVFNQRMTGVVSKFPDSLILGRAKCSMFSPWGPLGSEPWLTISGSCWLTMVCSDFLPFSISCPHFSTWTSWNHLPHKPLALKPLTQGLMVGKHNLQSRREAWARSSPQSL